MSSFSFLAGSNSEKHFLTVAVVVLSHCSCCYFSHVVDDVIEALFDVVNIVVVVIIVVFIQKLCMFINWLRGVGRLLCGGHRSDHN